MSFAHTSLRLRSRAEEVLVLIFNTCKIMFIFNLVSLSVGDRKY